MTDPTSSKLTTDPGTTAASPPPDPTSRLWRSIWRTHFYAGIFSIPVLVMLSITGLVILYTDSVTDLQYGDLRRAADTAQVVTLDDQVDAVRSAYPEWNVDSVTPPVEPGVTTVVSISDAEGETVRNVYVDPSNGSVLGDLDPGAGLVGLANRLHGTWNNDTLTVPMPMLSGILGEDAAFAPVAVGDLVVEIFAVWTVVLAITGLYLWWPRKPGTGRRLFVPRMSKRGRGRWRDLHAISGVVMSVGLVFLVVTGMPWSDFWGPNWSYVASEVTPNESDFWSMDAPASEVPQVGDLDRVGNRVPWAAREDAIPSSSAGGMAGMPGMEGMDGMDAGGGEPPSATEAESGTPAPVPAPASLDLVVAAAAEEGMAPNATITMPFDDLEDPASPSYGSFTVTNPWPSNLSEQGALFLDQFTATTISRSTSAEWGALQQASEFGVQTHMGTQFGLASRIVMTLTCVLILWSVFSALVMWWKRRRTGLGFPRRPVDVGLQRVMIVTAVVLSVIYPIWGLSVVVVLLIDTFVIRRVPALRRTFGQEPVRSS